MDFLLENLEKAKTRYRRKPYISERVQAAWAKLEKYYILTDQSIVYFAASVLNPSIKYQYFERVWDKPILRAQLAANKEKFLDLWLSRCANTATNSKTSAPRPRISQNFNATSYSSFLYQVQTRVADKSTPQDELRRYLAAPIKQFADEQKSNEFRALRWWTEPTQLSDYPRLSRMAFDMLTVPAMSAEIERVFSECSNALNRKRLMMTQKSIEELMCLRSWARNDARITPVSGHLTSLDTANSISLPL